MAYPNSYELVTLAEVKTLNNITVATYDTFISNVIPTICRAIENYCRRRFCKSTWEQWFPISDELITDNWPINNVLLVGVPYDIVLITDTTNSYNFNVTQTTSNNITLDAQLTVTDTNTLTATNYLFSTYTTVGALKTAVEAAHAGVTFAYQSGVPSTITIANLSTLSLRPTIGKTLYAGINYFDQSATSSVGDIYRLSDNSDRLILNPNLAFYSSVLANCTPYSRAYDNTDYNSVLDWYENTDLLIVYDSGYTTANIPQELKWITASIIRDLMSIFDVDGDGSYKGLMKSETLGDYSYTLGGYGWALYGQGDTSGIAGLLNKYHDQLDSFKKKII